MEAEADITKYEAKQNIGERHRHSICFIARSSGLIQKAAEKPSHIQTYCNKNLIKLPCSFLMKVLARVMLEGFHQYELV